MEKIDAVLNRFPQYAYDPENKSSVLYQLIKSIIDEFNITMNNINRIDRMLNIDTVLPDDLYDRFGALLNIKRNKGETDEQYRSRLKVSVTSLSGGTAEAIKYSIASSLSIHGDTNAMDRVKVYDAWNYDGDRDDIIKDYGYIVCVIDLNQVGYSIDIEKAITESANNVKAAGTIIQFIYNNYRVIYYAELDNLRYIELDAITYDKVGE